MQPKFQRAALVATMAAALTACGGDDTGTTAETRFSGRVTDSAGAPVAGVRVVLEDRTTDALHIVSTGADGSFSAPVNAGVYDVLFDDPDQMNYVSLQKTAVDLRSDKIEAVQLEAADAANASLLTGTMVDTAGTPVAHRSMLVLPIVSRAPEVLSAVNMPAPFLVQTDAMGRFSVAMGHAGIEYEFNVVVLKAGAPSLDLTLFAEGASASSNPDDADPRQVLIEFLQQYAEESIDVNKPDGAMQMKIRIGVGINNLMGAAGVPSVVPADAQTLMDQNKQAKLAKLSSVDGVATALAAEFRAGLETLIPAAVAGIIVERFNEVSLDVFPGSSTIKSGELTAGRIDVTSNRRDAMSLRSLLRTQSGSSQAHIALFFDKATINLHNSVSLPLSILGDNQIDFSTPYAGMYSFTDRTNDTYRLSVFMTSTSHRVNFRSKKPDIVKIKYSFMFIPQECRIRPASCK
jgi:hypothetical protein